MSNFIIAPKKYETCVQNDLIYSNWPVNLDLCACIYKERISIGFYAIKFSGCEHMWAFDNENSANEVYDNIIKGEIS